jgi:hypothetical protein
MSAPHYIVKSAVHDPARAGAIFKASELLGAQRHHAAEIRLQGETEVQCRARAWTTPEGRALRKALETAEPDKPIEVLKVTRGEAFAEIERRAVAIQKAAGHSIQRARTIVRSQDTALAKREQIEAGGGTTIHKAIAPAAGTASQKIEAAAKDLMATHPAKYASMAAARTAVRRIDGDLAQAERAEARDEVTA